MVVLVARFPMVLDGDDGGIEIGFDSTVLMFLLCTLDARAALAVWGLGVVVTQLTADKRPAAKVFNIGVGIVAGAVSAAALHAVRGGQTGTPRELAAMVVAAAAYFFVDYVFSAISVGIDSGTPVRGHLVQPGTWVAIACFVPFDLLGYLGAVVLRGNPWWMLSLLVVPLGTLLVATRAITRGRENARRLTVLLEAAVRVSSVHESGLVIEALLHDARRLIRLRDVDVRPTPPEAFEIGAQVRRGKDALWVVAPARDRARSTVQADQHALDALAVLCADAFARLQLTADMVHYARHDPLTDLPNRGILLDRVAHALHLARRRDVRVALLFIDLDEFKPVNDRFGHAAGDAVLVEVARRMVECTRESDTVARLGGDEFAVLLEDVTVDEVVEISDRILASLMRGAQVGGHTIPLGASIGIAYGDGTDTGEALLRQADLAMYEAKGRGKAQSVSYDPSIGAASLERLELVEELQIAIENGHLRVVYQPVVAVDSGRIAGVEALVRWTAGRHRRTDRRVHPPGRGDRPRRAARGARAATRSSATPQRCGTPPAGRSPSASTSRPASSGTRRSSPSWRGRSEPCRGPASSSRSPNGRRSATTPRCWRRCGPSRPWACGSRSTTSVSASPRSATCTSSRRTSSRPTLRWRRTSTATTAPAPCSVRSP